MGGTQNPPGFGPWEFDSHFRHQPNLAVAPTSLTLGFA